MRFPCPCRKGRAEKGCQQINDKAAQCGETNPVRIQHCFITLSTVVSGRASPVGAYMMVFVSNTLVPIYQADRVEASRSAFSSSRLGDASERGSSSTAAGVDFGTG